MILAKHQSSQSILNALPQLALLLYKEGLIGEMLLPTTSQDLLTAVQDAVCINYSNLEKFAVVLQKFTATVTEGDTILTEYSKGTVHNDNDMYCFYYRK